MKRTVGWAKRSAAHQVFSKQRSREKMGINELTKEASRERPTQLIDPFGGRLSRYVERDDECGPVKAQMVYQRSKAAGAESSALHF